MYLAHAEKEIAWVYVELYISGIQVEKHSKLQFAVLLTGVHRLGDTPPPRAWLKIPKGYRTKTPLRPTPGA